MRRKSVKSLKSRCFETLGPYVTKCIRKTVSNANSAEWYGMLHGNLNLTADYVITKQVTLLKNYLWSHIIWYDYDEMFLRGIRMEKRHFQSFDCKFLCSKLFIRVPVGKVSDSTRFYDHRFI